MILLALGLFGFAIVDLVRWSPEDVSLSGRRGQAAVAVGVAAVAIVAALAGMCVWQVIAVAAGGSLAFAVWVAFDRDKGDKRPTPGWPLAWIGALLLALFAASGSVASVSGPLESWYSSLGFGFVDAVSVDQFVLALSAGLFLTATANRIVRLVLDAAVSSWEKSETALSGGRVLGPLERLLIAAIILAGDPAAAAIVVTAKGLLRFPELRGESQQRGPDAITEYFLIGTFSSLLIAALAAVLVLAAG